jgi:hypothetical protein
MKRIDKLLPLTNTLMVLMQYLEKYVFSLMICWPIHNANSFSLTQAYSNK